MKLSVIIFILSLLLLALGSLCQSNMFGNECSDIGIGWLLIPVGVFAFMYSIINWVLYR